MEDIIDKNPTYLHVWGQAKWHDPVVIVGTTEALKRLKFVIENALEKGEDKIPLLFTGDEEGFSLYVICRDDGNWDKRAVPYFDEVAVEKNPEAIYPFKEIEGR